MNLKLQGVVVEKERLPAKRGLRIKLAVDTGRDILPVSCFAAEAEAASNLPIGTVVKLDCRVVGTEFPVPGNKPKRGVMLVAESLQLIPGPKNVDRSGGQPSSATRKERPRQWDDSWGLGA